MTIGRDPGGEPDRPMTYQIRVRGHLGRQWRGRFEGLKISLEDDGSTLLAGPVIDQAALFGLLKQIRDLGLALISVNAIREEAQEGQGDHE